MRFSGLARRLATAAVVLPLLALGLFWGPPWAMVAIAAAAALLGLWEFHALLARRGIAPLRVTGYVMMAALFVPGPWPDLLPRPVLPLLVVLLLIVALGRASEMEATIPAAAGTLLGAVYLGALGGMLGGLRTVAPDPEGPWVVMLLFMIVMIGDSMAYFVGSAIGRHKLAPLVSPGKSIEGLLGGIVGGVAGAMIVRRFGLPRLPLAHAIVLGIVVTLVGTAGDLAESLVKRWAGVKDSGTLFPGHGGMLDRLDSLLFGAPVLYHYFLYAYTRP